MDGREGMGMSGPASYFMHRGMGAPGTGSQPSIHAQLGIARSITNLNTSFSVQASAIAGSGGLGIGGAQGSAFQASSLATISPHGFNIGPCGGSGIGDSGICISQTEPVKRKRGRPRKYGPDGSVSLALSPLSSPPSVSGAASGGPSGSGSGSGTPTQKRGRGRPPGTGRKQQLASLGEWIVGSAGMGFTPHIITISVGEDIASKIMSFSQQGPRAICILSANGAVSTVTLRQPATSGGTVTYEGRFEILCLSGSYLLSEEGGGGSRGRSGGLSISLSSPDGRVIGGGVGGLLIAASPVQVIVGSFMYGRSKSKKAKTNLAEADQTDHSEGDKQQPVVPTSSLPSHTHTHTHTHTHSHTPSMLGGWASARNAHVDIDLMRG